MGKNKIDLCIFVFSVSFLPLAFEMCVLLFTGAFRAGQFSYKNKETKMASPQSATFSKVASIMR